MHECTKERNVVSEVKVAPREGDTTCAGNVMTSHTRQWGSRTRLIPQSITAHDPQPVRSAQILTTQIPKTHLHVIYPTTTNLQSSRFTHTHTHIARNPELKDGAGYSETSVTSYHTTPHSQKERTPQTPTSSGRNLTHISTYPAHHNLPHLPAPTPTALYKSHSSSSCNIHPSYIPSHISLP